MRNQDALRKKVQWQKMLGIIWVGWTWPSILAGQGTPAWSPCSPDHHLWRLAFRSSSSSWFILRGRVDFYHCWSLGSVWGLPSQSPCLLSLRMRLWKSRWLSRRLSIDLQERALKSHFPPSVSRSTPQTTSNGLSSGATFHFNLHKRPSWLPSAVCHVHYWLPFTKKG